jgi:hypothetical protein
MILRCREAPPCLPRPNGVGGEFPSCNLKFEMFRYLPITHLLMIFFVSELAFSIPQSLPRRPALPLAHRGGCLIKAGAFRI